MSVYVLKGDKCLVLITMGITCAVVLIGFDCLTVVISVARVCLGCWCSV